MYDDDDALEYVCALCCYAVNASPFCCFTFSPDSVSTVHVVWWVVEGNIEHGASQTVIFGESLHQIDVQKSVSMNTLHNRTNKKNVGPVCKLRLFMVELGGSLAYQVFVHK